MLVRPVSLEQVTPVQNPPAPMPDGAPQQPVLTTMPSPLPRVDYDETVIRPRVSDVDATPPAAPAQTAQYRDIYFSIPFNRAEYNANPSYRHDATMEFLFNQMRPTVIQRGTTNVYQYDMNGGYYDPPYYPYSYGLRIHRSR